MVNAITGKVAAKDQPRYAGTVRVSWLNRATKRRRSGDVLGRHGVRRLRHRVPGVLAPCFTAPVMPDDAFEDHPLSDEPADQSNENPT